MLLLKACVQSHNEILQKPGQMVGLSAGAVRTVFTNSGSCQHGCWLSYFSAVWLSISVLSDNQCQCCLHI